MAAEGPRAPPRTFGCLGSFDVSFISSFPAPMQSPQAANQWKLNTSGGFYKPILPFLNASAFKMINY